MFNACTISEPCPMSLGVSEYVASCPSWREYNVTMFTPRSTPTLCNLYQRHCSTTHCNFHKRRPQLTFLHTLPLSTLLVLVLATLIPVHFHNELQKQQSPNPYQYSPSFIATSDLSASPHHRTLREITKYRVHHIPTFHPSDYQHQHNSNPSSHNPSSYPTTAHPISSLREDEVRGGFR